MTDQSDIGRVIDALYAAISGPAGPRDWDTLRRLFHPDSRQVRTGMGEDGRPWMKMMGRDAYRADVAPYFEATDFYEVETVGRIDVFGNMAHVWSVYEARTRLDDPQVDRRGINSIQLYRDGDGAWRILSMIWDNERPGLSAPDTL